MNNKFNQYSVCRYQDGFSLLEILIAIAVLSIGLLSIAAMQMSAIKGNAQSSNLTQRVTAASNSIEHLLNLPYNDPDLAAGNHTPESDGVDNDGDGNIDEADDDGDFNNSVSWIVTDDTPSKKTISLTLTGSSYGAAKTVTINTVRVR